MGAGGSFDYRMVWQAGPLGRRYAMEDHSAPQQLDAEELVKRYAVYAEVMGRQRDRKNENDSDEHPVYKQAAFSLLWFYRNLAQPGSLNLLSQAFLGDEEAQRQLSFGEAPDASFSGALLEGKYPLNASQRRAIARALKSDISLIQGPPGTGKTEVILNLASCIIGRGKNVAVVANNSKAIDNITEKIAGWRKHPEQAGPNQRRLVESYARLGGKDTRKEWVAGHQDAPDAIRFRTGVKKYDGAVLPNKVFARYGGGGWEPHVRAADFLKRYPFITSTIHSFKKCFTDGDTFQFDYVIMDEASQCNPLLGLVAMSSAKHLVLVGDVEQLPPIYSSDSNRAIAREIRARCLTMVDDQRFSLRDDERDNGMSILVSAQRALSKQPVPHTFLDEHYRCHPGIIGFCNEFVYKPDGNELQVKTFDYDKSVEAPIRVRWFEGNYCERYIPQKVVDGKLVDAWDIEGIAGGGGVDQGEPPRSGKGTGEPQRAARDAENDTQNEEGRRREREQTEEDTRKLSRCNSRQIEIFMHEEWPQLCERLAHEEGLSACVLSPYRGVLEALQNRLRLDGSISDDAMAMEGSGGADPTVPHIPTFTIHKSQGQEFDIVYLLPGEDGSWEWPWTEAKALINVAVSRAKCELVIITSTALMSEETQAALVGERRVVGPAENMKDELSDEERAKRNERERFLQKLVDYARDHSDPTRTPGCVEGFPASDYAFGFHRSRMRSVFDSVPLLRKESFSKASSPEIAVENALRSARLDERGLEAGINVPLSTLISSGALRERWEALPEAARPEIGIEELEKFLDGESHFDFTVCDRETRRLLLAIEVDGSMHRGPQGRVTEGTMGSALKDVARQRRRDRAKDALAQVMGARTLADNSRDALNAAGVDAPTFTLLRLPTSGVTAGEFKEFKVGDETRFVTVEELLDDQLERGSQVEPGRVLTAPAGEGERPFARKRLASISALIRRWKEEDGPDAELFSHLSSAKANLLLAEAGYLEGEPKGWHVTELGERAGIEETREWFDNAKKGASMQTMIRYADEVEKVVKRVLAEALRDGQ